MFLFFFYTVVVVVLGMSTFQDKYNIRISLENMKFICTRYETGQENLTKTRLFLKLIQMNWSDNVRILTILLVLFWIPEFIERDNCSFRLELDNTFSINQSFKSIQVHIFHWCKHEMVLMLVDKKPSDLWKCRAVCCINNYLETIYIFVLYFFF